MSSDDESQTIDVRARIVPYSLEPPASEIGASCSRLQHPSSDNESSTSSSEEDLSPHPLDWCRCGHCVPMDHNEEDVCCHHYEKMCWRFLEGQTCITQHPGFEGNCLNQWVLEASLYEFVQTDGRLGDEEPMNETFRYLAYRRLVRWIFGRLGKKNRRILPACVVMKIRARFPSDFYMGFQHPVF